MVQEMVAHPTGEKMTTVNESQQEAEFENAINWTKVRDEHCILECKTSIPGRKNNASHK